MPKPSYRRDLPDGTRQYSSEHMERPDATQRYFDDMFKNRDSAQGGEALELLVFGREQSYPHRVLERTSEEYILHYVTEGRGRFNGRPIAAGEGFLIVPDRAHRMESDDADPWHFKWISFSGSEAKREMKKIGLDAEQPYFTFSFAEQLERLFDDVIYQAHDDCEINTYMKGIFYIILSYHKKERQAEQSTPSRRYAMEAMRYMDAHFREDVRVDEVAQALHISRKYLCALLSREIGMSTKAYLLGRRVDAAVELLRHTTMTVAEIAQEVGYEDYTQFSRIFRNRMGCSPQQFRKRNEAP